MAARLGLGYAIGRRAAGRAGWALSSAASFLAAVGSARVSAGRRWVWIVAHASSPRSSRAVGRRVSAGSACVRSRSGVARDLCCALCGAVPARAGVVLVVRPFAIGWCHVDAVCAFALRSLAAAAARCELGWRAASPLRACGGLFLPALRAALTLCPRRVFFWVGVGVVGRDVPLALLAGFIDALGRWFGAS